MQILILSCLSRTSNLFVLINALSLVDHAVFSLSYQFNNVISEGRPWSVFQPQMKAMSRSCADCASFCSRREMGRPNCVAFKCNKPEPSSEITTDSNEMCEFYTNGPNRIAAPGWEAFEIEAKGWFQTIFTTSSEFSIFLSSTRMNYDEARTYCIDLGGHLIAIDTVEKYEALATIFATGDQQGTFHVGANDKAIEGRWIIDRNNQPINWSIWRWKRGQPDNWNGDQDCAVLILPDMNLDDFVCPYPLPFLCERDV